jgi:hypothetical protein
VEFIDRLVAENGAMKDYLRPNQPVSAGLKSCAMPNAHAHRKKTMATKRITFIYQCFLPGGSSKIEDKDHSSLHVACSSKSG